MLAVKPHRQRTHVHACMHVAMERSSIQRDPLIAITILRNAEVKLYPFHTVFMLLTL